MTDRFHPISLTKLLDLTLSMLRENNFFGIPESLFHTPKAGDPFLSQRYGKVLETPIGLAAGPHTQLAQNIITGWLCGARYIELKTVQTLDELEVSKPCIDMQDEGYNCEWSQEMKIDQSFDEYLNAWIILNILRKELGFNGDFGTIFNMSVGYNLEGILKPNVQWFLTKMQDCSDELKIKTDSIRKIYPEIDEIYIPSRISDNITLSTMHGCPPDEIEKIGLYLIHEKHLHTTIKLNPTLLGAEEVRRILKQESGFNVEVPDIAFEHDLKYADALQIIGSLQKASDKNNLHFSIKLTNTLESVNSRNHLPEKEKMVYMSGRALHPISISLARKIMNDVDGKIDISFSAGADCFNIADIISSGLKPVTVCSDLLKPGGYGRLWQYINNLRKAFNEFNATSIDEFIIRKAGVKKPVAQSALQNLNQYADNITQNPSYKKTFFTDPDIKTSRQLGYFDCIHAPCVDTCPTNQDIPRYMHFAATGDFSSAFRTIFDTNPFPSVTGMICDHLCQLKCTRINYDDTLQIREVKRFISERASGEIIPGKIKSNKFKAAIIGAGPAGLSCAWYLKLAGFEVHVFEQKEKTGGMVSSAIPSFRLTYAEIERDLKRLVESGIEIHRNTIVNKDNFSSIKESHDVVFIAAGAQKSVDLKIEGIKLDGVVDPLSFLFSVKEDQPVEIGNNVVIIGGGNTAMDAARTAFRMTGKNGKVTVVYRRTLKEMPADKGEIKAVIEEGIEIIELANPEKIRSENGKVVAINCSRNKLSGEDSDGRSSFTKIPGSGFEISCDTIIPAIGQELAIDFIDTKKLSTNPGSYKTRIEGLYIGGDALRGASTAINAIADGRKAAEEIITDIDITIQDPKSEIPKKIVINELLHLKSIRKTGVSPAEISLNDRKNFNLVISSFSEEEAREEAGRCLQCDEICNVCVSVCPNLANFSYSVDPVEYQLQKVIQKEDGNVTIEEDEIFRIDQPFQVLNIRDFCNECGNCTTFCPTSGKPFKDKPGLSLSEESFTQESNGYILKKIGKKIVLVYKHEDTFEMLSLEEGRYSYETEKIRATIHPADFRIIHVKFLVPWNKAIHFRNAAEMSMILRAAQKFEKK